MTEPVTTHYPHKLRRLYWPFLTLAEACRNVVGTVAGSFRMGDLRYTIPRFTFLGPVTNRPQKRVGLFALLRGDEPEGAGVMLRLLQTLVEIPQLGAGYDLACYPVCNPTGYEDSEACTRAGCSIERELWRGSAEPEVRILEGELRAERFSALATLQPDGRPGRVRAAPEAAPKPFEWVVPIPDRRAAPGELETAHHFIHVLLDEYRGAIAQATDL